MLNLSYSTIPCDGWNIDKIIEYCKINGFSGLELKEDNSILPINSTQEQRVRIAKIFSNEISIFSVIKAGANNFAPAFII